MPPIIMTLCIPPSHRSPASFFKFKHEPEMTNDSCNTLFDTNHFGLLGTPDNLECAESKGEGDVLENEQLCLLTDENPLPTRQQWYVLFPNGSFLKQGISVWGEIHVMTCLISLPPKQLWQDSLMPVRRQALTCVNSLREKLLWCISHPPDEHEYFSFSSLDKGPNVLR